MRAPLQSVHANRSGHGGDVSTEWAPSWMAQAACRLEDPELFFPGTKGDAARTQTAEATAVCCGCPVLNDCLQHVIAIRPEHGVWAAMSEADRRCMFKARRRASMQRPVDPADVEHGTRRGYDWHRRQGEPPCDPCREAENARGRERRGQVPA